MIAGPSLLGIECLCSTHELMRREGMFNTDHRTVSPPLADSDEAAPPSPKDGAAEISGSDRTEIVVLAIGNDTYLFGMSPA